ncbi:hypothetical protein [Flavobacterium sp.]|uniref:hypothetical protein n=1 Tax=Flavobacterium sp. TaxID=239 RepID=UPI00404798DC
MKKIYLFLKILFITGFLIFFSCEKDDSILIDEEFSNSNPFKIEKLTFQQASKNSALVEKLNNFSNNSGLNRRIVATHNNDVYIDTDIVTYIEDLNGNHSYIFSMYSSNSNYLLENLVLSNTIDNTYRANIIQYDITEDELEQLKNGNHNVLTSRNVILKPFELNSLNGSLFRNGYTVCACGLHLYPGEDGLNYVVDEIFPDGTITWIQHDCGGGGSSSSGSSSGDSGGNTSGSNDGGWSGNGNTDGGTTSPGDGNTNGTSGGTSGTNGSGTTSTLITTPVGIDGTKIDPHLIELNKITTQNENETNILRNYINQLRNNVSNPPEEGGEFSINTDGSYNFFPVQGYYSGTDFLPVSLNNPLIRIHKHHTGLDPVPSAQDIVGMASFYMQKEQNTPNSNQNTNITSIMVSQLGVFAFRVSNKSDLANFYNTYMDSGGFSGFINAYAIHVIEKSQRECGGTCTDAEYKALLKQNFIAFMNSFVWGIDLYFASHPANLTDDYNWSKQ